MYQLMFEAAGDYSWRDAPDLEITAPEQAIDRLADLSGTVLDPKVFDALTRIVGRRGTLVFLDEDQGPSI